MTIKSTARLALCIVALTALVACGSFGGRRGDADTYGQSGTSTASNNAVKVQDRETTIWDIFKKDNSDITVKVNKYIWTASLEVLDFLPVESVDPFSGVIVTGYGTPPNGGRAYRATILVRDPALDARSLHLAMQTRGGRAVDASTVRAVEDAILARARQLRIADGRF
ncbi:DUF3576 domain-containing protein [Cognatishimia sp. WU-CL00825]|uniref:DUF3576 domain-containing protein n=1 Tax=Cognatishimia sp. WU-CL00825 TaxID=3127658 RepID=UPI003365AEA8